jgi:hypothetical protein
MAGKQGSENKNAKVLVVTELILQLAVRKPGRKLAKKKGKSGLKFEIWGSLLRGTCREIPTIGYRLSAIGYRLSAKKKAPELRGFFLQTKSLQNLITYLLSFLFLVLPVFYLPSELPF